MHIRCEIQSYSHRISNESFRFFDEFQAGLRLTRISEFVLSMDIDASHLKQLGSEYLFYHTHIIASSFLVALNIATVGYFCWRVQPSFHPVYYIRDADDKEGRHIALSQEKKIEFEVIRDITELDVENTLIIFGSLMKDKDSHSRNDYLKGLLHITASHFDMDFNREAFGNFYRCTEAFVTRKILKVKRLSKELKDFQSALKQIGAEEEIISVFKEVYAMRSNQVAHAQKEQAKIGFDDVLKAKVFADMLMYKTYRKQAEEWRVAQKK